MQLPSISRHENRDGFSILESLLMILGLILFTVIGLSALRHKPTKPDVAPKMENESGTSAQGTPTPAPPKVSPPAAAGK